MPLRFCRNKHRLYLSLPAERKEGRCRFCIAKEKPHAEIPVVVDPTSGQVKSSSRRQVRPEPKAITWVDATPKQHKAMASTNLQTGHIIVCPERVAETAKNLAEYFKEPIEDITIQTFAMTHFHELIHAIGQIGHTTQRRWGYFGAANKVFDSIEQEAGHGLYYRVRVKQGETNLPDFSKQVVDLAEISTDLPTEESKPYNPSREERGSMNRTTFPQVWLIDTTGPLYSFRELA